MLQTHPSTNPEQAAEHPSLRFLNRAKFVPSAEREDCVFDRAWEARPERRIRNQVSCRLCFRQVSRLTGKTAHLSTCHEGMTGAEYARVMPGHRHDCFQHSADANRLEVEKLMDNWCTEWATADEIRSWRRDDPKLAQAKEYVGCLECGRKLFSGAEIQRHVRKIHDWTLEQYRERYPGAPTGSLDRRAMQADKSTERWHELKQFRAQAIAPQAAQGATKTALKSGGRPKGMTDLTREEGRQLERYIGEFEKLKGTRRGAVLFACKKVYPSSDDPLQAVRRASKTLAKYRKERKNKTPL